MSPDSPSPVANPDWYRVAYALAAAYANRAERRRLPPPASERPALPGESDEAMTLDHHPEGLRDALDDAWSAEYIAERTLLAGCGLGRKDEDVGELFDDVLLPALLVLWAGATRTVKQLSDLLLPAPTADQMDMMAKWERQVEAKRSATVDRLSKQLPAGMKMTDYRFGRGISAAIDRLFESVDPDSDRMAPQTPDEVVEALLGGAAQIGYRLAYNLACYYAENDPPIPADRARSRGQADRSHSPSGQGGTTQSAEALLRRAVDGAPPLQRPRVASQALEDASLIPLINRAPGLRKWLNDEKAKTPGKAASSTKSGTAAPAGGDVAAP